MTTCPTCASHWFQEVGIGIQKIVSDLENNFPNQSIFRFDSDTKQKKSSLIVDLASADLIVSTHAGMSLLHLDSISIVVFLLFESDLTLPDYRMEEDLYHTLEYAKKSSKTLYIQTYIPDHPLLMTLTEGNYRDFLEYISSERKKFFYPPYVDFVTIRIHDASRDKLENMRNKLINKIETLKEDHITFFYEKDVTERTHGEWVVKLMLKGKNLLSFLKQFDSELIKNRSITLEWN
jgi:primosomal protein N' (replication factor Y) (superfamily II helicase)